MDIILNLFGKTGFYNQKSVLADKNEKIVIKLSSKQMDNVEYFVNGKKITNGTFEIDNIAGIYDFNIIACKNGIEIKKWECEPLIVKDFDDRNELVGELESQNKELKNLILSQNLKIKKLETKVSELEILCENTKNLVLELNNLSEKVVK